MNGQDEILQVVYDAIDEVNKLLAPELTVAKSPDTVLLGDTGILDSMGIINLVVTLDSKLVARFGQAFQLAEDFRIFEPGGPMNTIASLAAHLSDLARKGAGS